MARHRRRTSRRARLLLGLQTATGALAVAGGALLIARPDGSLLGIPRSVLDRSPFGSWLVPGVLLFTLVGCGFLLAAVAVRWAPGPAAAGVSILAGLGLVAFEICEVVWLGVQALELVFIVVGLAVAGLGLAIRSESSDPRN